MFIFERNAKDNARSFSLQRNANEVQRHNSKSFRWIKEVSYWGSGSPDDNWPAHFPNYIPGHGRTSCLQLFARKTLDPRCRSSNFYSPSEIKIHSQWKVGDHQWRTSFACKPFFQFLFH